MKTILRLYEELRRRRVFGVVGLYAVAAWAVIQVGDLAIEAGMISGLTLHNLFTLAIIGFPLALIVGWFYDFTRQGILRTAPAGADVDFKARLRGRDYLALLALLGIWSVAYVFVHTPPAVEKSIVVLPFENRGNDPENAHFAFGIRDDLMTQLQRVSDLTLIAGSASGAVDPNASVEQIGLRLGAAFIMKGTVERVLDRIRVNVVLIEAAEARQAWAGSYDRELSATNLFSIRDEVTSAIISNLQSVLSPEEKPRIFDLPTISFEANNHYMRGRQLLATRDWGKAELAVEAFRQAVEADPDFALAWVGLAEATMLGRRALGLSREEALKINDEALQKAMALNDQLGEVWAAWGDNLLSHGKMEDADAAYRKAIELAPNYARAYHVYQYTMNQPEQLEQKLALIYRAVQLDPMSVVYHNNLVGTLSRLGRDEEAVRLAEDGLEMLPDSAVKYRTLGLAYMWTGQHAKATGAMKQALERDRNNRMYLNELAEIYLSVQAWEAAAEVRQWIGERLGPEHSRNWWGTLLDLKILMKQERFGDALELMDTLPEYAASDDRINKARGDIQLFRGDFEAAQALWKFNADTLYQSGVMIHQALPDGYACIAAGLLMETGEETLGQRILRDSVQYFQDHLPRYLKHIHRFREPGICHLVQANYDEALSYFEERAGHGHFADWPETSLLPWWDPVRAYPQFIELQREVDKLIEEQRDLLGER